jgi:hypothetical protein
MQTQPPLSPFRLIIRQVRRVYRPFLIRPAHAYFFPAILRVVPRRLRIWRAADEEGGEFYASPSHSSDSHLFPL